MKKRSVDKQERQSRMLLLQDYEQWRNTTGSNSRMGFAKERSIDLRYLLNCIKWKDQGYNRKTKKAGTAHTSESDGFPVLVAVTKKAEPNRPTTSISESAISIRMRASSIDIAGDITPTLLAQLLSSLGALNVL